MHLCTTYMYVRMCMSHILGSTEKCDKSDMKSGTSTSQQALESGSAVELGKYPDLQYGMIEWIRLIDRSRQAYVILVSRYAVHNNMHQNECSVICWLCHACMANNICIYMYVHAEYCSVCVKVVNCFAHV